MTTLSVPGENDADNKKKSGSMSDDGMLFGSCSLSLPRLCVVCSFIYLMHPIFICADRVLKNQANVFL